MNKKNSVISNMCFIGALLIVALHTIPISQNSKEDFIINLFFHQTGFLSVTVPLFFGISGYLLVGHIDRSTWWKESVVKRLKTILIPFYAWTFIFVAVKVFFQSLAYMLNITSVTPNPCSNGVGWLVLELLGLDVFHQTGIVWYLRSLFLFVLVSPLLVSLAKKSYWLSGVVMICMLCLSRYCTNGVTQIVLLDGFLTHTLYLEGLMAFFLGIFLRIHPLSFNFNSTMNRCLISTFLVFLIIGGGNGFFIKKLIMILDVLIIYMFCSSIHLPDKLTSLSMPLYLTHMIVKWSVAFILNVLGLYDTLFTSLVFWPFEYCIIVMVSLLTAMNMKKTKVYLILYGGR